MLVLVRRSCDDFLFCFCFLALMIPVRLEFLFGVDLTHDLGVDEDLYSCLLEVVAYII